MLVPRILTAVVLLAIIVPALFSGQYYAFAALAFVFYGAALWESSRLFSIGRNLVTTGLWCFAFALMLGMRKFDGAPVMFALACGMWGLRFAPKLKLGLPPLGTLGNTLLATLYNVAILACFLALVYLYQRSPVYLLSAMAPPQAGPQHFARQILGRCDWRLRAGTCAGGGCGAGGTGASGIA